MSEVGRAGSASLAEQVERGWESRLSEVGRAA